MYSAVTRNIAVSVVPFYLEDRSDPLENRYVWAYRITIDNHIVAHEWGHYLHHRLAECGNQQCGAMSEGWGDFTALHMISREGDNLDGTYAASVYASRAFGDSAYYGIRRNPYSVDFSKNGLTFKHISDGVALPPGTLPGGPNSEARRLHPDHSSRSRRSRSRVRTAKDPRAARVEEDTSALPDSQRRK